jgi:hypothetical protein
MSKTDKEKNFWQPPEPEQDYPEQGDQTNFARTEKLTKEKKDD